MSTMKYRIIEATANNHIIKYFPKLNILKACGNY